jgi:hypothetical protein
VAAVRFIPLLRALAVSNGGDDLRTWRLPARWRALARPELETKTKTLSSVLSWRRVKWAVWAATWAVVLGCSGGLQRGLSGQVRQVRFSLIFFPFLFLFSVLYFFQILNLWF